MIEEQKLEEAVEWYEEDEIPKHLKTLLDLAEQFLALKEFPEKKEAVIPEHTWYNQAIDQCKLAMMKAPSVSEGEIAKTVRVYSGWDIGEPDCLRIAKAIKELIERGK